MKKAKFSIRLLVKISQGIHLKHILSPFQHDKHEKAKHSKKGIQFHKSEGIVKTYHNYLRCLQILIIKSKNNKSYNFYHCINNNKSICHTTPSIIILPEGAVV